jgi:hypothetical protein
MCAGECERLVLADLHLRALTAAFVLLFAVVRVCAQLSVEQLVVVAEPEHLLAHFADATPSCGT